MALRIPKTKKKKNPYRLSSDRQPGIATANKGKKKKGPRIMPIPKADGPRFERPIGRPTPAQQNQIPKDIFKKTIPFSIPGIGSLAGAAAKLGRKAAKKVAKKVKK
jgi:hypothetical protein